jgi:hypothetical protein
MIPRAKSELTEWLRGLGYASRPKNCKLNRGLRPKEDQNACNPWVVVRLCSVGDLRGTGVCELAMRVGKFCEHGRNIVFRRGMTFSFNGTTSLGGGWTSSSLFFTPTSDGFTLNFLGGPPSIAANNGCCEQQDVFDELGLDFNVTAPQAYTLVVWAFRARRISVRRVRLHQRLGA